MKKILIVAGLIGATLLTGCKKDSNQEVISGTAPAGTTKTVANTYASTIAIPNPEPIPYGITYKLVIMRQLPDVPTQWYSGYVTTSSILFNATLLNGNALDIVNYAANTGAEVNLFSTGLVGGMAIPEGKYDNMNFSVILSAANTSAGLMLNGRYNKGDGTGVPILITIDQPLTLTSQAMDNVAISDKQIYTATLYLSTDQLMAGISGDQLLNADKTNGVIQISAGSNTALYQAIFANLQNNRLQLQFTNSTDVGGNSNPQLIPAPAAVN